MSEYILKKSYMNHFGLDLKSSDLTRPPGFCSDMQNAQYRKNGSPEKRLGYQPFANSNSVFAGVFEYNRIDPTTNLQVPEGIGCGTNLFKLRTVSLQITYAGASPSVAFNLFFDISTRVYRAQILEGITTVLDYSLKTGFDEAGIITVSNLKTQIDALTGFSTILVGDGSQPAAFLKIARDIDLVAAPFTLEARYWTQINQTVTNVFPTRAADLYTDDFENYTSTQINNVIYIATGKDELHKYDGQTVYRAGLPSVASLTSALGAAGAITGNNYYHKAQYLQFDAVGNLVEGNLLRTTAGVNAVAQKIDVTVANVLAGSGFNTDCAIVNGAQVTTNTITVDDGSGGSHTMKAGDTAYFFDSVSADYVERNVTAVAATTITVAGSPVTVADNAVISNNLRIGIYRNLTAGTVPTVFYVVAEIPNNSFAATQVYSDNKADASLGAQLIEDGIDRSPPPKGKYISAFKGQMMIAGDYENQNTLYWSDILGPETFPNIGTNQADVLGYNGSIISGIAPNNEVFTIFQNPGIHVLSGDLPNGNIRIDQITYDLGCSAHATIQEIKGTLFFLSDIGPRMMIGGQLPTPIGPTQEDTQGKSSRIDPVFEQKNVSSEKTFRLKRSIGFHDRKAEKYWLLLPCESTTGGVRYGNSNTTTYVYDYTRDSWLKWNNLNFLGGISQLNNDLVWLERSYSTFSSARRDVLYRQHSLNDCFDYQDHTQPVNFSYEPQWESLGESSELKRFLTIRVFSLEDVPNNELVISVKTQADYKTSVDYASFDLDLGAGGYGVSPYGTTGYGDTADPALKHKLGPGRFTALRPVFSNNLDQQNLVLTGWELQIAAPYRMRFPS